MSMSDAAWRQYAIVTGNYWAFTLTDGALRMLVVLYFYELGYAPLEIALLFLFYEFFGVVTNLFGGWLATVFGLNRTMNIGLGLQIMALAMLALPDEFLSVIWVMAAQALSGIAKDLNKMSAKSAIKLLVPEDANSALYKWVALLTGSKNTLKGAGFFLGGVLLLSVGFQAAMLWMMSALILVWFSSLVFLRKDFGKTKNKPKFAQVFSKTTEINTLAAARLFLFAARDIWFVVALPVYFAGVLGWSHWQTGAFMACWVICYGVVQTQAPKLTQSAGQSPDGRDAFIWGLGLTAITFVLAIAHTQAQAYTAVVLVSGLILFGIVFAINSSLHSYLIVQYADRESVSMDVGFYYMANAAGRLLGTVFSGLLYQSFGSDGLFACLIGSAICLMISAVISIRLPRHIKA
ncbi:MAG: organoarsenical effux MFS transporter ArsJ [Pseudomonadota bacterium]